MIKAETMISDLEDAGNSRGATIDATISNLKKLQHKVTFLEDTGRQNNVRVVGIPENVEKQNLKGFALNILVEKLGLDGIPLSA